MAGTDAAPRKPEHDYIYGIDLVRFASAVSVAAFHLSWLMPGTAWLLPFGWVGVQVFFLISGLVIANSAQGATPMQFLASRFLRLYPTAWCAAAVSFPLLFWEFSKMPDKLQRLYFSIILFPGPFIATAYWTLPIELAFYFLIYSLIVFKGFRHIQAIAILLILWSTPYVVALTLTKAGWKQWGWVDFDYLWENMSLLRYGLYFGLGILIWLFKEKRLGAMGVVFAALALPLAMMEIYDKTVEILPRFAHGAGILQTPWAHLATASNVAFCAAFVAILISVKFNRRFTKNAVVRKTVRLLGLTTYPFYLLHERVGEFVIFQLNRAGVAQLLCVFLALIAIGIVSLLIAKFAEPALRGLLKKIGSLLKPDAKKPALETS